MEKNKTEQFKEQVNKIEEIKQNFVDYLGEEYQFDYAILKAQDYGVPQDRERCIMIGNRIGVLHIGFNNKIEL